MTVKSHTIFVTIFTCFFCFTSCDSSDENTEKENTDDQLEEVDLNDELNQGIPSEDSLKVNEIIAELKGIEEFAIKQNYDLLLALLQYKEDDRAEEVKAIIEKQELDYYHTFSIIELDPANGFIQYAPNMAEVTYTMTYWNMDDGSQLIAMEEWGCGPVCSSGLTFHRYMDGEYELLENKDVIPEIDEIPSWLVSDYDPEGEEPYEFRFNLPQKGKDIEYCLDDNCINLVLENTVFKAY